MILGKTQQSTLFAQVNLQMPRKNLQKLPEIVVELSNRMGLQGLTTFSFHSRYEGSFEFG